MFLYSSLGLVHIIAQLYVVVRMGVEEKKFLMETPLPPPLLETFRRMGYHLVGRLAGYKPCYYFKTALTDRIMCYKYWFYGIPTHRCIQWTPILECNLSCVFCWRLHRADIGLPPFRGDLKKVPWDDPEELIENVIQAYFRVVKGYDPKYREKTDPEMWKESMLGPKHLATSLDGEPTMYPYIDDLMDIAKNRGMTTFIVSNGTFPKTLENMHTLPTQLYISLVGPDYQIWARATRPVWNAKDQWNALLKTLELLPSLETRVVIRITAVKGLNMVNPEGYAKLLEIAQPDFIEIKGYTWVGRSRERLSRDAQPSMSDIDAFAKRLADLTGYRYIDKVERARIALLWNEETPLRIHPLTVKNAKR